MKIEESRQTSDLRMNEKNEKNQTRKISTNYEQEIKRKSQQEAYHQKNNDLEIKKIQR